MTKQTRKRSISSAKKPNSKALTREKTPETNGYDGFMFQSPVKQQQSQKPLTSSRCTLPTQLSLADVSSPESASKGNELFSPYPCGPKHKYPTRSNVIKHGKSNFEVLSYSSQPAQQYSSLEIINNINTEEEKITQGKLNHITLYNDGLDTGDLDTEEAVDSFCLMRILIRLRDTNMPPKRNILPPSDLQRMTLVLDLDETLVHCCTDRSKMPVFDTNFTVRFQSQDFNVFAKLRPNVLQFLQEVSKLFEVVIFTASQQIYADKLLDNIDPLRQYTRHRLFRDSCVPVEGTFVKDLRILGRDMSRVVIVDNAVEAFSFQVENGIPIKSWMDDENDNELFKLFEFLKTIQHCPDVRSIITERFSVQSRIDAIPQNY